MQKQIDTKTKAIYGFGSFSSGIKESAFGVFLIFFYTQVVGLSGTLAGTAMLCALIFDAISDPLIGHWSDNFHSKWGRRHPFMYIAILPVAISFYCLFNPPLEISTTLTFLWMVVFAVLVRLSITFYVIPSSSMAAEMTSNYHERTQLASFRVLFGWTGSLLMSYLAYNWLFIPSEKFEDGRLDIAAYQIYGLIGAIGILISILVSSLGTHHLIPKLHQGSKLGFTVKSFFSEFKSVLKNKVFLILFVSVLIASVASGVLDVFTLYINTYFWGFSSKELSTLLLGAMIGAILAFLGLKIYGPKFDKKHLFMLCIIIAIVAGPIPILLRIFDFLPDNGNPLILYLIIGSTLLTVFSGVGSIILAGSMIADIIDFQYLQTGKRQEGLHYSAFALSAKATTGLGGFVAGVTLDLISFPKNVSAEDISSQTLISLGVANIILVTIFLGVSLFLMSRYSLTRESHLKVMEQIKKMPNEDTLSPSTIENKDDSENQNVQAVIPL